MWALLFKCVYIHIYYICTFIYICIYISVYIIILAHQFVPSGEWISSENVYFDSFHEVTYHLSLLLIIYCEILYHSTNFISNLLEDIFHFLCILTSFPMYCKLFYCTETNEKLLSEAWKQFGERPAVALEAAIRLQKKKKKKKKNCHRQTSHENWISKRSIGFMF